MNIDDFKNIPLNELWIEWQVEPHPEYEGCLQCYGFRLILNNEKVSNKGIVSIPLAWINNVSLQLNWLSLLRNQNHIPKDPYELINFIRVLNNIRDKGY
jgi:hypothetical protein